ncbi:MAG: helix-turn-helix domain-containing protein, partial [Planctomycetota bacterium]
MERSAGYEMYVVVVRPSLLRGLASGPGFGPWAGWLSGDDAPAGPLHRVLGEAAAEGLAAQCAALASARWAQEPADGRGPAHFDAGLVWLAAEAWRAYAAAADRPEGSHLHPAVQRALEELDRGEHGDPREPSPLDLDAIARRCHVSRPHLSRLFHRETGMTLTEFRTRRRVERFLAALGRGRSVTLTQAAYAAGFGSYTQAFRSVKAVTGLGPREHLRQRRAG